MSKQEPNSKIIHSFVFCDDNSLGINGCTFWVEGFDSLFIATKPMNHSGLYYGQEMRLYKAAQERLKKHWDREQVEYFSKLDNQTDEEIIRKSRQLVDAYTQCIAEWYPLTSKWVDTKFKYRSLLEIWTDPNNRDAEVVEIREAFPRRENYTIWND